LGGGVMWRDVSIHSPYAGRDDAVDLGLLFGGVSIHSPYAGRDRVLAVP